MKQNDLDTIFAASNKFKSAIKIIRVTGKKAKSISRILNFKQPEPRTFSLRKLVFKNKTIDYAPVVWLPKKSSFTGEDTYEIYIDKQPGSIGSIFTKTVETDEEVFNLGLYPEEARINIDDVLVYNTNLVFDRYFSAIFGK